MFLVTLLKLCSDKIMIFQARVRILALIAKLFSISISVATMVYDSNLLNLYEAEISNTDDMLMCLSALELLYEVIDFFVLFFFQFCS